MIIYIDNDFKCHPTNKKDYIPIETNYFNNKCEEFIKGYRFIPQGQIWTNQDGIQFKGEAIFPFEDIDTLFKFQQQYEKYQQAIQEGVNNV